MERRIEQINDLIREELGKIVDKNIDMPEATMVTLTHAVTSPDKHYADVFISVMPLQREKEVLDIFAERIGEIQHMLNRKLRMRPVPRIKFVTDAGEKKRERIESLLTKEDLKDGEE